MTQTVEAVFENGILRPLSPLHNLAEHSRVTLTVSAPAAASHPLEACIGTLPDEDAEEMRRIIEAEFEKVDLSEWQ